MFIVNAGNENVTENQVTLEEPKNMCNEILAEDGIENEINIFSSAKDLNGLLWSKSNPFDLLILNIRMEGISGMELAQAIRKRGDRVSIIFITASEEYILEGYSVQPIQFLMKPIRLEALRDAIRTDLNLNHKPKND